MEDRKPIPENVSHYAQLKSGEFIGHWDIQEGKDTKVTIESIATESVFNQETNKKETKTVLAFKDAKKRMILNATNMKAIASWHGNNPHKWLGKEVTLFRTMTKVAGKPTECVRVRPDGGATVKTNSSKAADAAK